jgi:hypothetical protein
MKIKRLPAARGLVWIWQGFNLFKHNPQVWLVLSLANFVLLAVLEQIGSVGALLSILLSPVLVAGWLIGCHALAEDQPLKLAHLWAGFQHNTHRLISLGGVVLLTLVLISALIMGLGGEAFAALIQNWKPTDDPQLLVKALGDDGVGTALELLLVISIPLFLLGLSMQFAPMLIVFRNLGVLISMKISTLAFVNNIPPLTLYSLAWAFMYFILLGLPEAIHSLVMVIATPIFIASTYAAYRDVFPDEAEIPAP